MNNYQAQAVKIVGSKQEIEAVERLLNRVLKDVPKAKLIGLTIQFGIPSGFFRLGEKELALYRSKDKTIFLKHNSTEYDFYHELSHYLDDITGLDIFRHKMADRFACKWGISRRYIVK